MAKTIVIILLHLFFFAFSTSSIVPHMAKTAGEEHQKIIDIVYQCALDFLIFISIEIIPIIFSLNIFTQKITKI